jgi:polyisoprenoid-binding protein YceI
MSTATPTLAGTWAVDPANSKVGFAVKQMGIATVRGEFTEFQGILDLASATVQGTVIAASVDTNEPRRDEHLRSPDCFDVERHPELAFRSTSVEPVDETTFRILGELTLHGSHQRGRADRGGPGHRERPVGQRAHRAGRHRRHLPRRLRHALQLGARQQARRRQGADRAGDLRRQAGVAVIVVDAAVMLRCC